MSTDNNSQTNKTEIDSEIEKALQSGQGPSVIRFIMSCMSGLPIVGGPVGAVASAWSEAEQDNLNRLFHTWMKM